MPKLPKNHGNRWSRDELALLKREVDRGESILKIAMTIGISKARLQQLKDSINDRFDIGTPTHNVSSLVLDQLISECAELDPWLPIDENTPKDTRLLLLYKNDGNVITTGEKRKIRVRKSYVFIPDGSYHFCSDIPTCDRIPTHYKELPEPPKE